MYSGTIGTRRVFEECVVCGRSSEWINAPSTGDSSAIIHVVCASCVNKADAVKRRGAYHNVAHAHVRYVNDSIK